MLSRAYTARDGAPVIDRIDPRIFTLTYFGHCMACEFCEDSCCRFGADIEMPKLRALEAIAPELEAYLNVDRKHWFRTDPEDFGVIPEPEYPGGEYTRTSVVPQVRSEQFEEACVFLDPIGRGCRIHRFALERNIDVHTLKPMVCILFPLCYADGEIHPALELETDELVCQGPGVTLYRSVRDEVIYYFGLEMAAELDRVEASTLATLDLPVASSMVPLPMRSS